MRSSTTIQASIELGQTMGVYCANGHHRRLDLVALRDKFGPVWAHMADDILPKMARCPICGALAVAVMVSSAMTEEEETTESKVILRAQSVGEATAS